MTLSVLAPLGGAALGALASRAIGGLSKGLQFQAFMEAEDKKSSSVTATEDAPTKIKLDELVPEFASRLRDRLQAAGIDSSQPFSLSLDSDGQVVVDSDHPNRAEIEELFLKDAGLATDFQAIARGAIDQRSKSLAAGYGSRLGEFKLGFNSGTAIVGFE